MEIVKEFNNVICWQEPISFVPIGGFEVISPKKRETVLFYPIGETFQQVEVGLLAFEETDSVRANTIGEWCVENEWRLVPGFVLATLHRQLWESFSNKTRAGTENYKNLSFLERVVAFGDSHECYYVATSISQHNWALTFYALRECLNRHFKFAVMR